MKKILLVALLMTTAAFASAQLHFGVKGGVVMSTLTHGSDITIKDVSGVTNWQAGVLMQYKVMNFSIQPEINFSVKGGDLDNSNQASLPLADLVGSASTVRFRSQNLEIPVNFQYGMDFGRARVFVQAGPSLNIMLTGTINDKYSLYEAVDDAWGFNKTSLTFGVGGGAELFGFQLNMRYELAGKEIGKEYSSRSVNVNPFNEMKSKSLSLSLGYLF
jgi:hypothetical protein